MGAEMSWCPTVLFPSEHTYTHTSEVSNYVRKGCFTVYRQKE